MLSWKAPIKINKLWSEDLLVFGFCVLFLVFVVWFLCFVFGFCCLFFVFCFWCFAFCFLLFAFYLLLFYFCLLLCVFFFGSSVFVFLFLSCLVCFEFVEEMREDTFRNCLRSLPNAMSWRIASNLLISVFSNFPYSRTCSSEICNLGTAGGSLQKKNRKKKMIEQMTYG